MRIRDTLLALTATVVAGSAVAAVATPAAAQPYYGYAPVYERGYAPVYGYGYHRPWFEGRPGWSHRDYYRDYHRDGYRHW